MTLVKPPQRLCQAIQYNFYNVKLLKEALTHCSVGENNNERLEFLGDSVLNCVITQELFRRFSNFSEGELTRLRAWLVKGDTLAEIAAELHLGDYLHLGQGELKSGGFRRASILADALEAIIGAVFIDSGFESAQNVVCSLFETRLQSPDLKENLKDSKTLLQEFVQARGMSLPKYTLVQVLGEEHDQSFEVACTVLGDDTKNTKGLGSNRRKAEQNAAKAMLLILKR